MPPYFWVGYGKLRVGCGVRVGQSILRADKPPYVEVEGFPFWFWALGMWPYLQAGTRHGGCGLGPGEEAVRTVRASNLQEVSRLSSQLSCPSRKDTDKMTLPTGCDSPMFNPGTILQPRIRCFN